MPTKRMFDMIVITLILVQPVKGLIKMSVTRKTYDNDTGPVARTVSGAARIFL
jgi:hypothetical protein